MITTNEYQEQLPTIIEKFPLEDNFKRRKCDFKKVYITL